MDFDLAAKRLAKDQSKLKGRNSLVRGGTARGGGVGRAQVSLSAKAAQEAQIRKQQQDRMLLEKRKEKRRLEFLAQYVRQCEENLGFVVVKSLPGVRTTAAAAATTISGFTATSIHGEGDKIALPPSVLEYLTNDDDNGNSFSSTSPWTFRIGILNPNYVFPASATLQKMQVRNDEDDDDDEEELHDDSENDSTTAYLDELSHKYLAYTHGTVVEFTQDEGHVGLPAPIAAALLQQRPETNIPFTRTVDRASNSAEASPVVDFEGADEPMEGVVVVPNENYAAENTPSDDEEKTPGHLAWGAFDIPAVPIEISLVKLPKGKACTLVPTANAIRAGFYNLKDVKMVLEQSLIRTRATLTVQDMVHVWHRGVKYDLTVAAVKPATYNAVLCINTDIEVEFGPPPAEIANEIMQQQQQQQQQQRNDSPTFPSATLSGVGRRLIDSTPSTPPAVVATALPVAAVHNHAPALLLPEPPESETTGICTVQIRGGNGGTTNGRRRFHVSQATVKDLFAFAASLVGSNTPTAAGSSSFQLVTRFPRRVFTLQDESLGNQTLLEAGIQPGQELFLMERL